MVEPREEGIQIAAYLDRLFQREGPPMFSPCQVFYDPASRLQLHGASRQKIFREVFEQFWQCLETMPDRSRHQTTAAWRWVVETWLRRQGWITVWDKPQPKVSTNFEPFFSHN